MRALTGLGTFCHARAKRGERESNPVRKGVMVCQDKMMDGNKDGLTGNHYDNKFSHSLNLLILMYNITIKWLSPVFALLVPRDQQI